MQVPLSSPDIIDKDIEAVVGVMKTRFLSIGPKVVEFENRMSEYTGVKYAVAVNSGTSALHLIIRGMGIGEGDVVITTPFSFIASSNCILFERAKPLFVDIEEETLNLDADRVEEKLKSMSGEELARVKALLVVDAFGQPADWDRFKEIGKKYNLKLIEDSAEALGSEYKGKRAGSLGEVGVFAFYPNKQISTGEGGILVTDDEELARLARSMRNQGRGEGGGWLDHERLGYNFRMDELSAALGCSQMERIKEILDKRAKVAGMYGEKLAEVEEVQVPYIAPYVSRMSWFVYVIRLERGVDREGVIKYLNEEGVQCKPYFTPIHLQPFYRKMFDYKEGDFPVTEDVTGRTIALPFFNNLREEQIDYVVEKLKEGIEISR
ncbi:polysaccharide biosynthesis protein [Candidatus Atribacteria bacterium HGW-Atribacteria-1]|nr:MAG: polysaccharide biosynthesis protein [Candidatus Atribacteria bacterium HGW-Atribacteria-1]